MIILYSLFTRKSNACSSEFRQISICMYTIHIMTATGINHSGFVVPCSIRKQWHTKEVAIPKRVVFGRMKKVSKGMVWVSLYRSEQIQLFSMILMIALSRTRTEEALYSQGALGIRSCSCCLFGREFRKNYTYISVVREIIWRGLSGRNSHGCEMGVDWHSKICSLVFVWFSVGPWRSWAMATCTSCTYAIR